MEFRTGVAGVCGIGEMSSSMFAIDSDDDSTSEFCTKIITCIVLSGSESRTTASVTGSAFRPTHTSRNVFVFITVSVVYTLYVQ